MSSFVWVRFRRLAKYFSFGHELFVGVHCRRLPNMFSFKPRNLYIFGDISCIASRGADISITPTTDWRLYGKLSIL